MEACFVKMPTNDPISALKPFSYFASSSNSVLKNSLMTCKSKCRSNNQERFSFTNPPYQVLLCECKQCSRHCRIENKLALPLEPLASRHRSAIPLEELLSSGNEADANLRWCACTPPSIILCKKIQTCKDVN